MISALCCAIGLQWVALQSLAWATMLVDYSKHAPLCAAIKRTFDGAHPCSLCHAVNAGKSSEKKSELRSASPKIDMICPARSAQSVRSFSFFEYPRAKFLPSDNGHSPPVPPPRLLPS
jgi:hypothetical protein